MLYRCRRRLSRSVFRLAVQGGVAISAMSVALPVNAQPIGIPSMGPAASAELSPLLERTLGDAIMEQGRRDPSYINDPDVNQYLTQLGRKLAAAAPQGDQPITVFAIRDPQINAFALPGGYVGIHSGLVTAAENESQLASVVAHEIGHVLQRHVARGMTRQSQTSHMMMASVAAALLAALAGSGDLAMGVAAFGQAAAVDRQLGFSRQAEQEADRVGVEMLRKSGFDPRGMVQMFNQLMNASRLNEGMGGGAYASTHPLSVQRMSDIQNRVRDTAASTSFHNSDAFWYVRAKLRVLQAAGNTSAQRTAQAQLSREAEQFQGVRQSAAWFGLAYSAWQQKDITRAVAALQNAQQGGVNSPQIASLATTLALQQGQGATALEIARESYQRWPQNQSTALAVVLALQTNGRDGEAVSFLDERIRQWPDEPRFYQLKAQGHERLSQPVQARRAMAKYYEKTGAVRAAVDQLQQARGLSKDFYIQSQLDVEIRRLKDRLQSDRELLERFKQ